MNKLMEKPLSKILALSLGLLLVHCPLNSLAVSAAPVGTLKKIRIIDTNNLLNADFFNASDSAFPSIGFPPGANTLLLLNQPNRQVSIILVSPTQDNKDTLSRKPLQISDPINIAFGSVSQNTKGSGLSRLFLLDADLGELISIKSPSNVMDQTRINRLNIQKFGITDPQGMTVDSETGRLFVLDSSASPRIISIKPKPGREFADAEVKQIVPEGLEGNLRGLAFNPEDGRLYILSMTQQKLFALTQDGKLVSSIDIQDQGMPQGMIFAPSLDLSDHPSIFHLYLATVRGTNGKITEWTVP
jgi:hypothetical protein